MAFGSTGFVVGFSFDEHNLRVSKGLIFFSNFPNIEAQIDAHSDNGYSGGPILDHNGKVRGMVLAGTGRTVLTTQFLPSISIAQALSRFHHVPNLKS